jgi:hypothetical protein
MHFKNISSPSNYNYYVWSLTFSYIFFSGGTGDQKKILSVYLHKIPVLLLMPNKYSIDQSRYMFLSKGLSFVKFVKSENSLSFPTLKIPSKSRMTCFFSSKIIIALLLCMFFTFRIFQATFNW